MSLLSKIRNIFNEKDEELQEELLLDNALKQLNTKIENSKNEVLENTHRISTEIYSKLKDLHVLLSTLEKEDLEDKRGKASKDIKDRFCSVAKQQISSIENPEKDFDDVNKFLNDVSNTLNNLGGLTPKQMLHIKFFFAEQSRNIPKRTDEIRNLVNEARKEIEIHDAEYIKIKTLRYEIEEINTDIKEKSGAINDSENYLDNLRNRVEILSEELKKINTDSIETARKGLEEIEKRKRQSQQEADSYLDIERLIKKLKYEKKINDYILDAYVESPSKALIMDAELKIIDSIKEGLKLYNEDKIDIDKKKAEKAEEILNNPQKLKELRKNILDSEKELAEKEKELEKLLPLANKRKNIEKEKVFSEEALKKAENTIKSLKNEIAQLEKNKERLIIELKMSLSEKLNVNVV